VCGLLSDTEGWYPDDEEKWLCVMMLSRLTLFSERCHPLPAIPHRPQLAGGLLAATIYVFLGSGHAFDLGPYGKFSWGGVVVAEVVYTCLLCYVVLSVATVKDMSHSQDIFGLAIGFAVVAGGWC
jgi:hypothetical protein